VARRIVAIAVCFSMVLYTSTRYFATHVLADDNSRMFYPAFGHDLRETVPHVPVPALETVAIARVMADFHGVTIINNNVAEELTEDSTITRGSEIVTGTETGVVFHVGGSRTLILDRSSRIRFNVLNWLDGDLLVQVEHLDGILINDVAGQLTGSSVHETVIIGEDGERFEVGVLGASYLTYINPSDVTPEEAEQNIAEFSEAYGEALNVNIRSVDDALVFFFEGAGTVRNGDQLVEIVVGEGAILSEGQVNVTRFPLERISSLPQLAQNFKELKRIDAEVLATTDHRSDPIIQERLEMLQTHEFVSDKPFFDNLSFYEFPIVIEPMTEEASDDEHLNEQNDAESHEDDESDSMVQDSNEERDDLPALLEDDEGSNRITDILFEWSARGESPEVTEPHEETAILLREDELGESEPENDDDDGDNDSDLGNFRHGINTNQNQNVPSDVEAENPNDVNAIEDAGYDQNNPYESEINTGIGAIYPQLGNTSAPNTSGPNAPSVSDTGNDVGETESGGFGYGNDLPDPDIGGNQGGSSDDNNSGGSSGDSSDDRNQKSLDEYVNLDPVNDYDIDDDALDHGEYDPNSDYVEANHDDDNNFGPAYDSEDKDVGADDGGEADGYGFGGDDVIIISPSPEYVINGGNGNINIGQGPAYDSNVNNNVGATYGGNDNINYGPAYDSNVNNNVGATYGGNGNINYGPAYDSNVNNNVDTTYGGNGNINYGPAYDSNVSNNVDTTYGGNDNINYGPAYDDNVDATYGNSGNNYGPAYSSNDGATYGSSFNNGIGSTGNSAYGYNNSTDSENVGSDGYSDYGFSDSTDSGDVDSDDDVYRDYYDSTENDDDDDQIDDDDDYGFFDSTDDNDVGSADDSNDGYGPADNRGYVSTPDLFMRN